jgi:hypothetical protein
MLFSRNVRRQHLQPRPAPARNRTRRRGVASRGTLRRLVRRLPALGTGIETTVDFAYTIYKKPQVEALISEAWECLRRDGLIMPAPGINGQNGRMVLTGVLSHALNLLVCLRIIDGLQPFPRRFTTCS